MNDKFKDLKATVDHVLGLKNLSGNKPKHHYEIEMSDIEDIFQIIDNYSNDPKKIEREYKKHINTVIK